MWTNVEFLVFIGTRPELIKLAPVVRSLRAAGRETVVVCTGQHKELLGNLWKTFGIEPDIVDDIITPGQSLASLTSKALQVVDQFFEKHLDPACKPVLIAQGDTTTVLATGMIAFYRKLRFAHIEAGLRSGDLQHPYPEEFNRRVVSLVTDYHFAPTQISRDNLLREGISSCKIFEVGNTVIDSLEYVRQMIAETRREFDSLELRSVSETCLDGCVLITCHRRENQGANLQRLIAAVEKLAIIEPATQFIWPLHLNPRTRKPILDSGLSAFENVRLIEPLDYLDLVMVLERAKIVLTDSGGIQEEAPSFGVPLLVLRETTERPEAVEQGMSKLVGCESVEDIVDAFNNFRPVFDGKNNPYGDGLASRRICEVLMAEGER